MEAIEVLARRFRLEDVFVHDVRRTAGGVGVPQADLADCTVLAEDVVHVFGRYFVRQTPEFRKGNGCVKMHFGRYGDGNDELCPTYLTNKTLFTSGGSRLPVLRTVAGANAPFMLRKLRNTGECFRASAVGEQEGRGKVGACQYRGRAYRNMRTCGDTCPPQSIEVQVRTNLHL